MKHTIPSHLVLKTAGILACALQLSVLTGRAGVIDLSTSASGGGFLPGASLNQGSISGLGDGSMYTWNGGAITSPRVFSGTNLQPYLTWSSTQSISSVRVTRDIVLGPTYNRVAIDVLVPGGSATNEGDWQQVYDSGTGINANFLDIDLGQTYNTQGIRTRAYTLTNDITVGEVAVFGGQAGALSSYEVTPTTATASSVGGHVASNAADGNWNTLWRGNSSASNPGSDYFLDLNFATGTSINGASLTFSTASGNSPFPPGSFKLQYSVDGIGFTDINTYSLGGSPLRIQNYYDFGTTFDNVTVFRLLVPETGYTTFGPSVVEFEAFNVVPEPSGVLLAGLGLGVILASSRAPRRTYT